MDWIELNVRVSRSLESAVLEALDALASGVATEYPGGFIGEPGEAHDIDPDAQLLVKAYFSEEEDAMGGAEVARDILGQPAPSPDVFLRFLPEQDWAELWKRYFGLQRISPRLVIVPTWKEYRAKEGERVIRLDPGMAFGTGQHPTTRLCLAAIERLTPGARVLDVGAGSGILSIAALLCGADHAVAIDIDRQTLKAAEENARLNGVEERMTVAHGTPGERWPAELPKAEGFDLVVANISARAICAIASDLAAAASLNGAILTSGFLEESVADVRGALEATGLKHVFTRRRGEWRLVAARRSR